MKRSALRICCAFVLMGMAVAISAGTIVFADETARASAAPMEDELLCARMVICADESVGEILLCALDGTPLQTLACSESGQALTEPLAPDTYRAFTQYGCAEFRLLENAAVEVISGYGWSDGERLHLTRGQTGTLTLELSLSAQTDGWLDFVLTDGETRRREVVYYSAGEVCTQCVFAGVPFGSYTLEESGTRQCTVVLGSDAPEQTLCLRLP